MFAVSDKVPNPGSDEAIEQGCTCAILDNGHGQGFPYDGAMCFYITHGCPLHSKVSTEHESGN